MNLLSIFTSKQDHDEYWYRSEMNFKQFDALAYILKISDIENEILNNNYFLNKVSKAKLYSNIVVAQWLKNSWNTESILAQNIQIIRNTNQSFCMQWAFPQAYYTVFGNILALFNSIGYTEISHTAVLKKYAGLMLEGKLPESISFLCDGVKGSFQSYHISFPDSKYSPMEYDRRNHDTISLQICQFLKATRELRLKEKAPQMNFRTAKGKLRKKLKKEHWEKVSKSIGPTSIIDFLYRKRIKGNYQDIETYNSPHFKGEIVLKSLIKIVDRINLVNETYISKAIGFKEFNEIASFHLSRVDNAKLRNRLITIETILKTSG